MNSKIAVVILAAGLGTRMKSNKAKVLHEVCGRPMVSYVVETARKVAGNDVILVVGNQADKVRATVSELGAFRYAHQEEQLGTGHAVLRALPHIPEHCEEVVIIYGDVPLIKADTVMHLVKSHTDEKRDVSVLAVALDDPTGYGRILLDENSRVRAIVEESDATAEQKGITLINSGIFCIKKEFLLWAVPEIKSDNVQGEIYLTDIVEIAYAEKKHIGVTVGGNNLEVTGINTVQELKKVERVMKNQQLI
ncbi:MAG: NTP transferase domain-containing protein [Desulfobacterales bacterium]|jgi:UDP-N-acetylglucosamine diphosphorylase/glucosamine-1-phosphate N-acetyltransferase